MFHLCTSKNKLFLGSFLSCLLVLAPSTVFCTNFEPSDRDLFETVTSAGTSYSGSVSAIHNDEQDYEKEEAKQKAGNNDTATDNDRIIISKSPAVKIHKLSQERLNFYSHILLKHIYPHLSPIDIHKTFKAFHGRNTIGEGFEDYFTKIAYNFSKEHPDLFLAVDVLSTFDDFHKSQKAMSIVNGYNNHFPRDRSLGGSRYNQRVNSSLKNNVDSIRLINRLAGHPDMLPTELDEFKRLQNFKLACEHDSYVIFHNNDPKLDEWLAFLFRDTQKKNMDINFRFSSLSTEFIKLMLMSMAESGCAEFLTFEAVDEKDSFREVNYYILSNYCKGFHKTIKKIETKYIDDFILIQYLELFENLETLEFFYARFSAPLKFSEAFSHCFSLKTLEVAFSSVSVDFLWSLVNNIDRFPQLKEFRGMTGCNFNDAHIPPLLALKQRKPEVNIRCFYDMTENGLRQVVAAFSELGYNQFLHTRDTREVHDFVKIYNNEWRRRYR